MNEWNDNQWREFSAIIRWNFGQISGSLVGC